MSTVAEDLLGAATKMAEYPPLKPADRSCAVPSAQALVRVIKGTQDLLFCAHGFAQHEAKLIADGWTVYEDIRDQALNPPTAAY